MLIRSVLVILHYFKKIVNLRKVTTIFIFSILALIFTFPVIHNFHVILAGDDYLFHLSRIYSLYNGFQNHHFISGLDYNTFSHRGTAFNIFYPYLTTGLPIALLKGITHNWFLSFKLFIFFITLITLLITYQSSYYLTHNKLQSYLLSLLFVFSNYRIVDAYTRFDLGEFTALSFVPLVLITLEIMIQKKDYSKWYWLGLGMTAIFYSHLLTALLISFIMLIRIIFSLTGINKLFIMNLLKAASLTIILTLYQLVSVGEQLLHLNLETVDKVDLSLHLLPMSDTIINSLNNTPVSYTFGLFVLIMGLLTLTNIRLSGLHNITILPSFALGSCIFLATTSLFPWFLLNRSPFNIIQFPFRLTMFGTFYLLFAGSITFVRMLSFKNSSNHSLLGIVLITFVVLGTYVTSTKVIINRANEMAITKSQPNLNTFNLKKLSTTELDDYRPANLSTSQRESIQKKYFSINHQPYSNRIKLHSHSDQLSFFWSADSPTHVDTPIIDYKGISVFDNKKKLTTFRSSRGTIAFKLSQETKHHITVQYTGTVIRKIAFLISLGSLFTFLVYFKKKLSLK